MKTLISGIFCLQQTDSRRYKVNSARLFLRFCCETPGGQIDLKKSVVCRRPPNDQKEKERKRKPQQDNAVANAKLRGQDFIIKKGLGMVVVIGKCHNPQAKGGKRGVSTT